MKNFLLSCLLAVSWLLAPAAHAASSAPAIFHVTETAFPGDIVGLQGGNFGPSPQVWLDQITGSDDPPQPEVQAQNLLRATNEFIAFRFPANFNPGLCAVFVRNPATGLQSKPVWINRAEV